MGSAEEQPIPRENQGGWVTTPFFYNIFEWEKPKKRHKKNHLDKVWTL